MSNTRSTAKTLATAIAAIGCLAAAAPAQAGILGTFVATTPSGYQFPVPAGDTVFATATGAAGGDYADDAGSVPGGLGGLASGAFAVAPGERLSLVVAGKGRAGSRVPGGAGGCTVPALPGGYPGGGWCGRSVSF
jgi:hypothetical protein